MFHFMGYNGGGMRSWRSDESLTSPTETEVETRFDLSNPHKPSHDLYHVLPVVFYSSFIVCSFGFITIVFAHKSPSR